MATASHPSILLVHDEPHALSAMQMALEDEFDILTAEGAAAAEQVLAENWVQVIFCDQRMPGKSGIAVLTEVHERWLDVVFIIIITDYTDPGAMIGAINDAGIQQFLTKPWHPDRLLMTARNAARLFQLGRENERLALEMRFLTTTSDSALEKRRRALREGAFTPVGGHESVACNLRLIAGAERDLRTLLAEGQFRTDLFYLIAATELDLPPLRGRPGDVALLAHNLLIEEAGRHGKPVRGLAAEAAAFQGGYDWPGNLRELQNEITRMLVFAQEPVLGADLFSGHILQASPSEDGADRSAGMVLAAGGSLTDRVELIEARNGCAAPLEQKPGRRRTRPEPGRVVRETGPLWRASTRPCRCR